jgi:hypothetical protein
LEICQGPAPNEETFALVVERLRAVYPNTPQAVAEVLWAAYTACPRTEQHRKLLVKTLLSLIEAPAAEAVATEEEESEEEA